MLSCLNLSNRVAVVIGATSGLGRAIAVGLAEQGADVAPSGRRLDRLEEVCREIEAAGGRALGQRVDVTDRKLIDALRDPGLARLGRIDILVEVAGGTPPTPGGEGGGEAAA